MLTKKPDLNQLLPILSEEEASDGPTGPIEEAFSVYLEEVEETLENNTELDFDTCFDMFAAGALHALMILKSGVLPPPGASDSPIFYSLDVLLREAHDLLGVGEAYGKVGEGYLNKQDRSIQGDGFKDEGKDEDHEDEGH